ncbi:hypothetical protein TVAG_053100 [Trichomonas vaginalis G3]|uniref:Uncharacterized protein n=1 Tax=Trichomonas vaginalis (strain ATCC PRA-98 / G3) TaxID=412133 RepID=A2F6M2_TRIV3|nr:dextransucrase protein [Trichomonas vaginalis G3]EAX99467.1 hypothetical protein TVAG_053100 [Trichomonas vaginalis G3]KAI5541650.1 dextransucrase protein [Trichomonas vaginalis G3]|eukprot:XP_001312397.1 hypothetical protein [Trichomonas vaginalis G3]
MGLRVFFARSNTANFNILIDDKQTTYSDQGYYTVFKVDNDKTLNNCKITTVLSSGSSNMFSNIGYKVYNSDTRLHTIGIATHADIQINNNDYASIYNLNGNTGFRMTDGTYTLSFVLRGFDSPGVDTYWYGRFRARIDKMWNNGTGDSNYYSDLENIDCGIAFSWQDRRIGPGETLYFNMGSSSTNQDSSYKPSLTVTSIADSYRPCSKPFLISGSLSHSRRYSTTVYIKYRFDNNETIYTDANSYGVKSNSPKDFSNNMDSSSFALEYNRFFKDRVKITGNITDIDGDINVTFYCIFDNNSKAGMEINNTSITNISESDASNYGGKNGLSVRLHMFSSTVDLSSRSKEGYHTFEIFCVDQYGFKSNIVGPIRFYYRYYPTTPLPNVIQMRNRMSGQLKHH